MRTEKKVLNTIFASDTAKKTISVDDPLDTLDAETVSTNMDAIVGLNTLCRAIISKASHLCRKNRSGRCLCQNSASGWRIPQAVRW